MAFTRFPENLTSDLEVELTKIGTLHHPVLELLHSQTQVSMLPTCLPDDNSPSAFNGSGVKIPSVLTLLQPESPPKLPHCVKYNQKQNAIIFKSQESILYSQENTENMRNV